MSISPTQLARLVALISAGEEWKFYNWQDWRRTRDEVRRMDHWQCSKCSRPIHNRRECIAHHVKPLRERPDLALSIFDPETGDRQIITVCKQCHEEEHPDSLAQFSPPAPPVTAERWD